MIDRSHRVVSGDDYRAIVRRGRRISTPHAVLYVLNRGSRSGVAPAHEIVSARFGFIVSKAVGNAVIRNRMRRRLKSIAADHLVLLGGSPADNGGIVRGDIVIRALPGSHSASWATLATEIGGALRDGAWSRGRARA